MADYGNDFATSLSNALRIAAGTMNADVFDSQNAQDAAAKSQAIRTSEYNQNRQDTLLAELNRRLDAEAITPEEYAAQYQAITGKAAPIVSSNTNNVMIPQGTYGQSVSGLGAPAVAGALSSPIPQIAQQVQQPQGQVQVPNVPNAPSQNVPQQPGIQAQPPINPQQVTAQSDAMVQQMNGQQPAPQDAPVTAQSGQMVQQANAQPQVAATAPQVAPSTPQVTAPSSVAGAPVANAPVAASAPIDPQDAIVQEIAKHVAPPKVYTDEQIQNARPKHREQMEAFNEKHIMEYDKMVNSYIQRKDWAAKEQERLAQSKLADEKAAKLKSEEDHARAFVDVFKKSPEFSKLSDLEKNIIENGTESEKKLEISKHLPPSAEDLIKNKIAMATLNEHLANGALSRAQKESIIADRKDKKNQQEALADGYAQDIADHKTDYPSARMIASTGMTDPQLKALVMSKNKDWSQGDFKMIQKTRNSFAAGPDKKIIDSLRTVDSHLDVMQELFNATHNKDTQAWNRVSNWYKTQTGKDAPTNATDGAQIVGTEVAKSVLGGEIGASQEREAYVKALDTAISPKQGYGAIKTFRELIQGKQKSSYQNYKSGTMNKDLSFDDFQEKFGLGKYNNTGGSNQQSTSNIDVPLTQSQQSLADKYK